MRSRSLGLGLILPLALVLAALSCSSPEVIETGKELGEPTSVRITRLWPHLMRVRRPKTEAADPTAKPGGSDYNTVGHLDSKFDCRKAEELFPEFPAAKLRACFLTIPPGTTVTYRFVRQAQPFLEIEDPEDAPACMVEYLRTIPVPREIIFQTPVKSNLDCYTARVDLESSEKFGIKMPIARLDMAVRFPLRKLPTDDDATLRLVQGWALTPFFKDVRNADGVPEVSATLMPERLCKKCMGEKTLSKDLELEAPLWP
ncbi:MAG: hypothetical protein JNL01_06580 [Bdellovibrionales bacterium]|nr:hypothetical protein [Bdellovibrionales bacterium]